MLATTNKILAIDHVNHLRSTKIHTITCRNVNEALDRGLHYLKTCGVIEPSRNGTVLVAPGPVATVYTHPTERVMFSGLRDANPFFHLFEALYFLAGKREVAPLAKYSAQIANYSDDGAVFNAAYGYRWRHHFGFDQISKVVRELKADPNTRRAVIGIWDPDADLMPIQGEMKDVACNLNAIFDLRGGRLNMTVTNRSNDVIWGAYGANVVQFSMLQEYIARHLEVRVGQYIQFSNNYHIYCEREDVKRLISPHPAAPSASGLVVHYEADDRYKTGSFPKSIFAGVGEGAPLYDCDLVKWREDLSDFIANPIRIDRYNTVAFNATMMPMFLAYEHYKRGEFLEAIELCKRISAPDWGTAAREWIMRRPSYKRYTGELL